MNDTNMNYIDLEGIAAEIPAAGPTLRSQLFASLPAETWAEAAKGFGDPDLANQ